MPRTVIAYVRQHHIGLLALFIALSGTAYAATLPRNSVGTAQLKKNAVTSAKVKDRSLLTRDFKAGQLPRGPRGPVGPRGLTGPSGPQGPQGVAGRNGATNVIADASDPVAIAAGATEIAAVDCGAGERAVGGGGFSQDGVAVMTTSVPTLSGGPTAATPTGWLVEFRNDSGTPDTIFANVVCAAP